VSYAPGMATIVRTIRFAPGSRLFARRADQMALALRAEGWRALGGDRVEFFGVPKVFASRPEPLPPRQTNDDPLGIRAALERHRRGE